MGGTERMEWDSNLLLTTPMGPGKNKKSFEGEKDNKRAKGILICTNGNGEGDNTNCPSHGRISPYSRPGNASGDRKEEQFLEYRRRDVM